LRVPVGENLVQTGVAPYVGPVAIIGAGVAGLACARSLVDSGIACMVFEKSRGRGGRAATRRIGERSFDHGAPSLTARDPKFCAVIDRWRASGDIQEWAHPIEVGRPLQPKAGDERLVPVPSMSALGHLVGGDVPCEMSTRITDVIRGTGEWRLLAEGGRHFGPFVAVVVAVPAPQAVPLLVTVGKLAEQAAAVEFAPCWTVMTEFAAPVTGASGDPSGRVQGLAWAVYEASRPGRAPGERWVLHANAKWSVSHLSDSDEAVVAALLTGFASCLDGPLPEVKLAIVHRWLHAVAKYPLRSDCLWDSWDRIGACGDWCSTGDIEGAWRSGRALATLVRATLR
jgi:renalase